MSVIWCGREVSRPYHGKRFWEIDTTSFQEIIISSGVFRRETASGFYPWGKVDSPRKRVAEGLCGWRHGNEFPMTQSAQSHRQMRSIPFCSKAVFYVFIFDSTHDSATMHYLSPGIFHWTGTCLWHVSNVLIHCSLQRNMPKACPYAMALLRDFRAVGNGILWLTPCKLACERSLELKSDIAVSVGDGRSW